MPACSEQPTNNGCVKGKINNSTCSNFCKVVNGYEDNTVFTVD
jgi:hypothetical protein